MLEIRVRNWSAVFLKIIGAPLKMYSKFGQKVASGQLFLAMDYRLFQIKFTVYSQWGIMAYTDDMELLNRSNTNTNYKC